HEGVQAGQRQGDLDRGGGHVVGVVHDPSFRTAEVGNRVGKAQVVPLRDHGGVAGVDHVGAGHAFDGPGGGLVGGDGIGRGGGNPGGRTRGLGRRRRFGLLAGAEGHGQGKGEQEPGRNMHRVYLWKRCVERDGGPSRRTAAWVLHRRRRQVAAHGEI